MASAREVIRCMDWAREGIKASPVIAVRMSRAGASADEFVRAVEMAYTGVGGHDVPRDSGHIRRRANRNHKRNRAARTARKAARG